MVWPGICIVPQGTPAQIIRKKRSAYQNKLVPKKRWVTRSEPSLGIASTRCFRATCAAAAALQFHVVCLSWWRLSRGVEHFGSFMFKLPSFFWERWCFGAVQPLERPVAGLFACPEQCECMVSVIGTTLLGKTKMPYIIMCVPKYGPVSDRFGYGVSRSDFHSNNDTRHLDSKYGMLHLCG